MLDQQGLGTNKPKSCILAIARFVVSGRIYPAIAAEFENRVVFKEEVSGNAPFSLMCKENEPGKFTYSVIGATMIPILGTNGCEGVPYFSLSATVIQPPHLLFYRMLQSDGKWLLVLLSPSSSLHFVVDYATGEILGSREQPRLNAQVRGEIFFIQEEAEVTTFN